MIVGYKTPLRLQQLSAVIVKTPTRMARGFYMRWCGARETFPDITADSSAASLWQSYQPFKVTLANFTKTGNNCSVGRIRGTGQLKILPSNGGILEVLAEPYLIPYFTIAAIILTLIILCIFPTYVCLEECRGNSKKPKCLKQEHT